MKYREQMNHLLQETQREREQLQSHPLYSGIRDIADVRRFMQTHVFAVWDFMSLLKALQRALTSVTVPWIPVGHPAARFINEIVRDEESDVDRNGEPVSHFQVYRQAMIECGSDTACMDHFLESLKMGSSVACALDACGAPEGARRFVKTTFRIIDSGNLHQIAAAFAFGREDLIPEMFSAIVRDMKQDIPGLETFHYYLQRHIQLDGDDHSPHAYKMVMELCRDDANLWEEAISATKEALSARIQLWDSIIVAEPVASERG